MSIFNSEHYPDPTAAEAMDRVMGGAGNRPDETGDAGVLRLAEAVVASAARDYADLVRCPWRSEALLRDRQELDAFFRSDWFRLLTGLNGSVILKKIREEALSRDRA